MDGFSEVPRYDNPEVYERNGEWFFRTEDESEIGPYASREYAEEQFSRYCDEVLGPAVKP